MKLITPKQKNMKYLVGICFAITAMAIIVLLEKFIPWLYHGILDGFVCYYAHYLGIKIYSKGRQDQ